MPRQRKRRKELVEIVLNERKTITKIYHIADIHIRLRERHEEYKQVFEELYKYLEKEKSKNGLIVVCGDVVHSKTELSPECISITRKFFKELSEIMPTIVILGNHDLNERNEKRMDSLTGIMEETNITNFHLLKNRERIITEI